MRAGEIMPAEGTITINAGRPATALKVKNLSDHPVQVTSHFHFFEVNRRLLFDRSKAFGMRLDIPAGSGVRFEPGEEKEVRLVPFAGAREAWGFNGLVNGPLTTEKKEEAIKLISERGFANREE